MKADSRIAQVGPAVLCAAAGAALFQYWGNATHGYIATNSLFYWWGYQWVNPESENEHAWLVFALSVFLLVRNLRRDGAASRAVPVPSLFLMLGAVALHTVGYVAQQPRVSIAGLLLFAWGALAFGGGSRWRRASAFPLGFMVFAIPLNALDTVGFWLQMGVAEAGERLAHLAGIAVIRNGTQLFAADGRYQYDVVAACSGIRSLMALSALSVFVAYVWFRPIWLRAAVLLACVPLVYLGNVVRITAIILAAQWGGQAWGDHIHFWMGLVVFLIVVGGVMVLCEGIARARPLWTMASAGAGDPMPAPSGSALWPGVIAIAVVLGVAADAAYLARRSAQPPSERAGVLLDPSGANPVELPTFLGSEWMGTPVPTTAIERITLPPDTGYSKKLYVNRQGVSHSVLLSIVLSGRDRTSIHRPELCLVGQGWTILGSYRHRFSYPGDPRGAFDATILRVRRVSMAAGQPAPPQLVAYWFVGADRIVASQIPRMAFDAWNRLSRGRADRWAYVLLQTQADDGEDAGLARFQSILDSALPRFQPATVDRSDPPDGG